MAPVKRSTNTMALASLVTSIVSLIVCSGFTGFVGAILGHLARQQIKETGEEGDGLALAGIIIGWVGTGIALVVIALTGFFIYLGVTGYFDNTSYNY